MLGVAASNYFYYVAIQKTSVAIAIIVQYTAPVWVLLYVVTRGQQKLSLRKVAAVGIAIAGIALTIGIVGTKSASALASRVYGVSSQRCWRHSRSRSTTLARHRILARYDRWRVLIWTLTSAAVFWLFVNPPWKVASGALHARRNGDSFSYSR